VTRNIKTICIAIIVLFAPALVHAQVTAPPRVLSEGEQQVVVRRGAAVFAANCTGYCHGEKGTAGSGAPALANRGFDGDYISKTVLYGVPNTAMLGWGQRIPKDDSAAVIAYVKSLNGIVAAVGNKAPPPVLTPAAQHGSDLFFDTGADLAGCSNCHQVGGKGIPVTRQIVNVPADVSALRSLAAPDVSNAIVNGRSFPALVISQVREETKLYDLTTVPPVLLGRAPSDVKLSDRGSWQHSSVLGNYSDADLQSILEFLRATNRP